MEKLKAIVYLGVLKNGSSMDAVISGYAMGFVTVVLTDKMVQLNRRNEYLAVSEMYYCDLTRFEEAKMIIKNLKYEVVAIMGFVEPFCHLASLLANEFGIGRFSSNAIKTMQNKILSRRAIASSLYAPWFKVIENLTTISIDEIKKLVPFVLKVPNSTGSKEVYLIKTLEEYILTRDKLRIMLQEPIIIEEYLDGPQYLVETLVVKGEIKIVAVIRQEISYVNNHFIVTGYTLLYHLGNKLFKKLTKAVERVISLHGMENGACHLELRYVKRAFKLIEVNPRISGGAMNKLLEIGLGVNLVKETLKLAMGMNPEIKPKFKKYAHLEYVILSNSGVLLDVSGVKSAQSCKGVRSVYIKPQRGARLYPPRSLADRYAYVIAVGNTETEAKSNAINAARLIKFIFTG